MNGILTLITTDVRYMIIPRFRNIQLFWTRLAHFSIVIVMASMTLGGRLRKKNDDKQH